MKTLVQGLKEEFARWVAWWRIRWLYMTDYVNATHTVRADLAGYFYPRAYRDVKTFALGLFIPYTAAFLGAAALPVLGIWWGVVALVAFQLGGTVREVFVGGTGALKVRFVDQPIRLACGLYIPVAVQWGLVAGVAMAVGWTVVYLILIPRLN